MGIAIFINELRSLNGSKLPINVVDYLKGNPINSTKEEMYKFSKDPMDEDTQISQYTDTDGNVLEGHLKTENS